MADDSSPAAPRPSRGLRRTLYVDTPSAIVRKRRGRVVVEKPDGEKREKLQALPACEVDRIVCVGRVHCTSSALRHCLWNEIDVVFLSRHGRYQGRLDTSPGGRIEIRQAQHAAGQMPEQTLKLSRAFVKAKIHNMTRRLQRRNRSDADAALPPALQGLRSLERRLPNVDNHEALRGLEGAATNAYFGAWNALIQHPDPDVQFSRRTRRPPEDPVNAILGFSYALLQADVHAACVIAGLDPYLGLLHRPRTGCPSAVLDLMEAFRPVVADSVTLAVLNRRMVSSADFETRDGGVFLNESGRKQLYRAYQDRRTDRVTAPGMDRRLPYYRIFELQARRLGRSLTEGTAYTPFLLQ